MDMQNPDPSYISKIFNVNKSTKDVEAIGTDDAKLVSFLTIDSLAKVNGDIETSGDVVIDGVFNGSIVARNLKVTKRGRVNGIVHVKVAEIAGSLMPEIFASEKMVIHETGSVIGKIISNKLEVHLGAKFLGTVEEFAVTEVKGKVPLFKLNSGVE
jgi:cytoskeletal protein CcmA (bactofilin family)